MTAVLTANEIENTRFHLGYGCIQVGGYPWTPDGFFELFTNVIAQYLSVAAETTAATAIAANSVTVVTPAAMTGITANERLIVDSADDAEVVVVKAVTGSSFTARFIKSHTSAGYTIAVESGASRLRFLLHQADLAWQAMMDKEVTASIGLKSLAREEIVWFGPYSVLKGRLDHYASIVAQISRLIRVEAVEMPGAPTSRMEAY